ncbi:MAG: hypothetical protein MUC53_08310 [Candidatus Contendobacter sp.]|jgi:uncharacterized membrane protein YgcG|nr:hypothetical protein [Candidatus Contendobacter sp.]
MSDQLAQLQALLAQAQPQPATTQPAASGWAQPATPPVAAGLPITGISIPVKIDTPLGSVRVDLHLPAEFAASPQALQAAVQLLSNAGLPVDAWQSRSQGGWGNSGGSSGGWGGQRQGGYSGGGYRRGGW